MAVSAASQRAQDTNCSSLHSHSLQCSPSWRLICVVSHLLLLLVSPIAGLAAELLQLLLSLSSSLDISSKAKLLASTELSSSCEELRSNVSKPCLVTLIPQWLRVTSALVRHRLQVRTRLTVTGPLNRGAGALIRNDARRRSTVALLDLCKSCTCPSGATSRLQKLPSGRGCNPCSPDLMKHLPFPDRPL